MNEIDNPLKLLILSFQETFAEWLLGQPVRDVRPLSIELPVSTQRSDLVFEAHLASGQTVLLHIELQGRSSDEPMPWRMLEYMTRIARREFGLSQPDGVVLFHSAVIYVGQGAGSGDTGMYHLPDVSGATSLAWSYSPIFLWQMDAEELLALDSPAILALIGQTRISEPDRIVRETLLRISTIEDSVQRSRLLSALTSLISDQEILKMAESIISADDILLDTPYLRRIRQQGKEEGRAEGRAEGLREAVLLLVSTRFNPPVQDYLRLQRRLAAVSDHEQMQQVYTQLIQAESMAELTATLERELSAQG